MIGSAVLDEKLLSFLFQKLNMLDKTFAHSASDTLNLKINYDNFSAAGHVLCRKCPLLDLQLDDLVLKVSQGRHSCQTLVRNKAAKYPCTRIYELQYQLRATLLKVDFL